MEVVIIMGSKGDLEWSKKYDVKPVIACPPYSDKFAGADIFSSLRMPSGVAPMVVLEPEQAAIAAAKILAIKNKELKQRIKEYQEERKRNRGG